MVADPSRKSKRKPQPRVEIDDDLAELASVLDGNRHKANIDGWLSVPWRSGWCAARLPLDLWDAIPFSLKRGDVVATGLRRAIMDREKISKTYQQADNFRSDAAELFVRGCHYSPLLMATARCIQIEIANSGGGGHIFNDALTNALRTLQAKNLIGDDTIVNIEKIVTEVRCQDAIGTTAQLQNDRFDRERRAFAIAWKRGLYQAAYSIPFVGMKP